MSSRSPGEGRSPSRLRSVLGALSVTALDAALLAAALGGVPALLRHDRALALLVVWGVGALVLSLRRPVREHDPVEVRPDSRWAMPALFVIPLVTPPLSALGERLSLWMLPGGPGPRWAGVALAATGFAIRIGAMSQLGSRFSPLVAVQRGHQLETRGLYSLVRHPGYLGAWLATAGSALAFGSMVALPLVVLMLLVLLSRVRREEEVLERHFGDIYRRYQSRTGRLVPRLPWRARWTQP